MSVPVLKIPIQSEAYKPFIKQGDTIPEILFNVSGLDLTGATIRLKLYDERQVRKVLDLSTGSGITLLSAITFKIDTIPAAANNLPIGILKGDLEITLSSGVRKTYCNVEYTILKEYTI